MCCLPSFVDKQAAAAARVSLPLTLLKVLLALIVVAVAACYVAPADHVPGFWAAVGLVVALQLLITWRLVMAMGRKFVNKPCLVPDVEKKLKALA